MSQNSSSKSAQIQRHGDFREVENARPDSDASKRFQYVKTLDPQWKKGQGANDPTQIPKEKVAIDPNGNDRGPIDNYKLLISAIVPRPIAFISTLGKDGAKNLAPFSYFNTLNSDPPIFSVGFSGDETFRNTCKNILDTGECTINIISEWFIEAANYAAIDSPYGVDEWELSGLTPQQSLHVKPPHVAESVFSVEAKLVTHHQWKSKAVPGKVSGITCILEGIQFHVAKDAVNDDLNSVDITKLRPVGRLGGISYARIVEGFELPRPSYEA